MVKFNKNIFQVWFQGEENITKKEFLINKNNWKQMNSTWNYFCVSNNDLIKVCKLYSKECYEIYKSLPYMHMKIDLGRYVLLYIYGGIYVDMDAYILRSLDSNKTINDLIKSYENSNNNVIGLSKINIYQYEQFISGIVYNNAIMISNSKNPVLKLFIEYILKQCKNYLNFPINFLNNDHNIIQMTTGPYIFNTFFKDKTFKNCIIYNFEPEVFEPCDLNHECIITPNTIAIHQFEMTWIGPVLRNIFRIYFYTRKYLIFILIIILLIFYK